MIRNENILISAVGINKCSIRRAIYWKEVAATLTKHGLLKNELFIMEHPPENNQDKFDNRFMGKTMFSLRVGLEEAKKPEKIIAVKLPDCYKRTAIIIYESDD